MEPQYLNKTATVMAKASSLDCGDYPQYRPVNLLFVS